jgi:putative hemolysin
VRLDQLSYANEDHPPLKRWLIRTVEGLSGRDSYRQLYDVWRRGHRAAGASGCSPGCSILIDIRLDILSAMAASRYVPDGPLVIIANHPFGIGDGIAVLAMAEALGTAVPGADQQ